MATRGLLAPSGSARALLVVAVALVLATFTIAEARSVADEASAPVIPSPNQELGSLELAGGGIQRVGASAPTTSIRHAAYQSVASIEPPEQVESSNEASVPVYASPFQRAQLRGPTLVTPHSATSSSSTLRSNNYEQRQESSHAPPNYAPIPVSSQTASASPEDLKTSASYGHHHHGGHYGHEHSGWLDMGAWTGGKGSFGWYADYPVGGKQHYHHGYGRR